MGDGGSVIKEWASLDGAFCPCPQCRLRVEEWNLTNVGNYFHEEYKKELQHAQAQQIYQEMLAGGSQLKRSRPRGGAGKVSDQLDIAPKGTSAASNLQQKLKLTTGMQKRMEVRASAGMKCIIRFFPPAMLVFLFSMALYIG